jgi:hypothetical protein
MISPVYKIMNLSANTATPILECSIPDHSLIINCQNGGTIVISLINGDVTLNGVEVSDAAVDFWKAVKQVKNEF